MQHSMSMSEKENLHWLNPNSEHIVILWNERLIHTEPFHANRYLLDGILTFAMEDVNPEPV